MKCSQAESLFSPSLDNELGPEAAAALRHHLVECRACAHGLLDLRGSLSDLRGLPTGSISDLPDRVLSAVASSESARKIRIHVPSWRQLAAAAGVLVALGGAVVAGRLSKPDPVVETPIVLAPAPSEAELRLREEQRHRDQGEVWVDGQWRDKKTATARLMAERGAINRNGLWMEDQALDQAVSGKVLANGQWVDTDELIDKKLKHDGYERVGRSWFAREDRKGMIVDGTHVDEDRWLEQSLIAEGYERDGDGHWLRKGAVVAKNEADPKPVAAPEVKAEDPIKKQELALAEARKKWQPLTALPGFAAVPGANNQKPNFSIGRVVGVASQPTRDLAKAQEFAPGKDLTGWKIAVAGSGAILGTPAIADGIVLIGGGMSSYEVYAFEAATGKPVWRDRLADNGPSNPVVVGDSVAYTTESCSLYELDAATGRPYQANWIADPLLTMPMAAGSQMLLTAPSNGGFALASVPTRRSGGSRWAVSIPTDLRTAPLVARTVAIGSSRDGGLMAWNLRDGKEQWRTAAGALSAPALGDGGLVVRRALKSTDTSASYPVDVYGEALATIDPESGKVIGDMVGMPCSFNAAKLPNGTDAPTVMRTFPSSLPEFGPAIVYQSLAVVARDQRIEATDLKTGLMVWSCALPNAAAPAPTGLSIAQSGASLSQSDLCLAGDLIVVGTTSGTVMGIEARTGAIRWTADVGSQIGNYSQGVMSSCRVQPVVSHGRVFVTTLKGELVCIDTGDRSLEGPRWWGDR